MREFSPSDESEAVAIMQWALAEQIRLSVVGEAMRSGYGRPVDAQARLVTRRLSGVVFYEPAELVVCARAGTPIRDVVALLDDAGQEFAFEPIDHGRFYGAAAGGGTIGGLVATNASGPRRFKAGAARDHLLGFRAVTGRADLIKSGGRVMKNVTGYDLSKLVAGSFGTLAALTEVTLKVLPKAETETTLLLPVRDEAIGLALVREASGLPFDFSGLAVTPGDRPRAALRLEGSKPSVAKRRDDYLAAAAAAAAMVEELDAASSRLFWADLRDGGAASRARGQIWRISTAPTAGGGVVEAVKRAGAPIEAYVYDWAGGLVWLALEQAPDAHAEIVRGAVDRAGGHATLMRAQDCVRAATPVFHPQSAGLSALTRRVKESFDPLHLLERGRMRPDF